VSVTEKARTLNRILLSDVPMREALTVDGRKSLVKDGSGLPYLVEEFVALSAVEVLIPDLSIAAEFVDGLVPPLQERVKVVDAEYASTATAALCAPLAEELGLELEHGGLTIKGHESSREAHTAFATFYFHLPMFLLGVKHELQIDVDIDGFKRSVQILRTSSRSSRTRATLAAFEGILATYRRLEVPGLVASSTAPDHLVNLFQRLVEDETYRRLSETAHSLGTRRRASRSLQLMRRMVEDIATRKLFQQMFRVGTRAIETATTVPLPDSGIIVDLMHSRYLPVVVSLHEARLRASQLWREQAPPLIPPKIVAANYGKPK
jgi:hypothetical protein